MCASFKHINTHCEQNRDVLVLNYLVHIVTSLPVSALTEFPLQNFRLLNESLALNAIPRKVGVVDGNMATMRAGRHTAHRVT
jgi:hypothetical protein